MLISVHLPKTAGRSFARTLEDFYGDKFLRDSRDIPLNIPPLKRKIAAIKYSVENTFNKRHEGVDCIHGHFMPLKYCSLSFRSRDTRFITWLREPVDRLVSHYYYWNRRREALNKLPLHQKVVEQNWTLEQFCLSPELKNTYQKFLWGFPYSRFSFVGITEFYNTDLECFSRLFLDEIAVPYEVNVRSSIGSTYDVENTLREKIEKYHSTDVKLYRKACQDRLKRIEHARL